MQNHHRKTSLLYSIRLAALQGSIAWTIYAIVECLFLSVLPWLIRPSHLYVPVHWGFTGFLFIFYPFMGFIMGSIVAVIVHLNSKKLSVMRTLPRETFLLNLTTLTIVLAYLINFLLNLPESLGLSELPPISVSIILLLASALSAISNTWFFRLRFCISPWTVSFVLLGLPWINEELLSNSPFALKATSALVYPCIIFTFSFFIKKFIQILRQRRQKGFAPIASSKLLLSLLPVVLVLFVLSLFLKQRPLVETQNSLSSSLAVNRPSVILIVMDTVRADHLSVYGYKRDTTPNLKAFSKQATLFTHAIAPSDTTLSSHASIFTGLYPSQHGANYGLKYPFGRGLSEKFNTLAEILSENGYLTMGITANVGVLGFRYKLNQGFHFYDPREKVLFFNSIQPYFIRQGLRNILTHFISPSLYDFQLRNAGEINKVVYNLFDKANEDNKQFFFFINYMDTHWPYIPPPPFDKLYPGKAERFTSADFYSLVADVLQINRKMTQKEYSHLVSQYDGGISFIDFHIGKLIEQLKALKLYKNTLIIITSDHGEAFGEKSLITHGVSVYQNQVHVPLVIKYPNISNGLVVDELISLVDLMPTTLDVLGYEIPKNVQGQSLFNLKSSKKRTDVVISESFPSQSLIRNPRFQRVERAIFEEPNKLICSTSRKPEFYNFLNDPNENENLYKEENELAGKLEARLNKWFKTVKEPPVSIVEMDKATLERLKSLGYVK